MLCFARHIHRSFHVWFWTDGPNYPSPVQEVGDNSGMKNEDFFRLNVCFGSCLGLFLWAKSQGVFAKRGLLYYKQLERTNKVHIDLTVSQILELGSPSSIV